MAANFRPGSQVKLNVAQPQGEVQQLSVSQEGDIQYLVEYVDAAGDTQQRWFTEAELAGV
jgi:hypothetical protein